jgi:hypothetical protein
MKKEIYKKPEEVIRRTFPIKAKTSGWYFRIKEISNNAWEVEGTDQWGRLISRQGSDPEQLMAQCEVEAEKINEKTKVT